MERWGDGVGDGGLCRQLLRRPLPLSAQALPSRPALDREARGSPRPAPEREADRPLTPCAPGHHGYTHFTLPRTVTESAHEPPLLAGRLQSQVHSTAWVRARARPAPAHTRAAGTAPGARGPRSAWRPFHSLRSVRQADLDGRGFSTPHVTKTSRVQRGREGLWVSRVAQDHGWQRTRAQLPEPSQTPARVCPSRAGKAGSARPAHPCPLCSAGGPLPKSAPHLSSFSTNLPFLIGQGVRQRLLEKGCPFPPKLGC